MFGGYQFKLFDDLSEKFEKGKLFDFAKGFNSMKTGFDKVQYVENLPFMKGMMKFNCKIERKSNVSAVKHQKIGNSLIQKDINGALREYNLAILYSVVPTDSRQTVTLSMAYSNRSELLFIQCRYADAILDIGRAFKYGLPSYFHLKLWKRKGECYDAIGSYEQAISCYEQAMSIATNIEVKEELQKAISDAKEELNYITTGRTTFPSRIKPVKKDLSKSANVPAKKVPSVYCEGDAMNPSVSSCLSIDKTKDGRKRVFANKNIPPGEPIIVEDPFAHCLGVQHYHEYCYHCLKQTDTPVPCQQCVMVVYCHEDCRDRSWEQNHKVDCKILHLFQTSYFKNNAKLQSYLLTCLKVIINTGFNRLKLLFKNNACGWMTDSSRPYLDIFEMEAYEGESWSLEEFKCTIYSVILLNILDSVDFFQDDVFSFQSTEVGELPEYSALQIYVGSLMLNQLSSLNFRGRFINEANFLLNQSQADIFSCRIGYGTYPTYGLLMHSCDPNTCTVNYGSTAVVYSTCSILKGEELTDNSLDCNFHQHDLNARKEIHQEVHRFVCSCAVCSNDYPVCNEMPSIFSMPFPLLKSAEMAKDNFTAQFFHESQFDRYIEVLQIPQLILVGKLSMSEMSKVLKCLLYFEKRLLKPYKEIVRVEMVLVQCLISQGNMIVRELDSTGYQQFVKQFVQG